MVKILSILVALLENINPKKPKEITISQFFALDWKDEGQGFG